MSNTTKKTDDTTTTTTTTPATGTPGSPAQIAPTETGTLSLRVRDTNQNHHLWNNNGTWWLHYTLHLPDYTKKRVRKSLRTASLTRARKLRDRLLSGTSSGEPQNCEKVVPPDGLCA